MKIEKFVTKVLALVKKRFPELYKQHIKGRRLRFIDGNAPIKASMSRADMGCKRLGYLNDEMRLLWALSEMFRKSLPNPLKFESEDVAGACMIAGDFTRGTISKLCYIAFWEYVSHRFHKKGRHSNSYVLRPDWSIGLLPRNKTPKSTYDNTLFDNLLVLIAVQSGISNGMNSVVRHLKQSSSPRATP